MKFDSVYIYIMKLIEQCDILRRMCAYFASSIILPFKQYSVFFQLIVPFPFLAICLSMVCCHLSQIILPIHMIIREIRCRSRIGS